MRLRRRFYFFSLLVGLFALSLFLITSANAESYDDAQVRLAIHVMDLDQTQKAAELKIFVFISDFPYNLSGLDVWVAGAGDAIITCNNTGQSVEGLWYYQGESQQTTWLLEGKGEHFPLDSYKLRFKITRVDNIENYTLSSEGHQAFFTGPKWYSLKDYWFVENELIPVGVIQANEVSFIIQRSASTLNFSILQFLVPIIGCYYLLGATLLLDPKKQLTERLRINLSLFVFLPTFLIAIQNFLPYRASLSFPEFLLVNLMISNIVFSIFSVFGNQRGSSLIANAGRGRKEGRMIAHSKWDLIASVLSLVLLVVVYVFTFFNMITAPLSLFFTYIIIPSYIYFYFALMSKKQLRTEINSIAFFVFLGLIPLGIFIVLTFIS